MINTTMKNYNYFLYGQEDEYGQLTLSEEATGSIKMSINILSQSTQDNILYKGCSYLGLTMDKSIDDTYIIICNNEKLKVKYINPVGRYKQIYMEIMSNG
jgi:hypothetical protein